MSNSFIGNIQKLISDYTSPISYALPLGDLRVPLNPLLEKNVTIEYLGEIYCIQCQRRINKTFQQGYCYPCFQKLMDCNLCIIHPERCSFPDKPCPNDWAHEQCSQPHVVYIANSSDIKVGITRKHNIPTRWIDQGAIQGLPFIAVHNRRQAGLVEVFLKKYIKDKTNWRQMLVKSDSEIDLNAKKFELINCVSDYINTHNQQFPDKPIEYIEEEVTHIHYPIVKLPVKLNSLSFEKNPISATLLGIKGQYLIFDTGVINIRKYGGYKIKFSFFE